jgi:heavy metal sensor kinase
MRLPIRTRLTLVSVVLIAAVIAALGLFLYLRFSADLLDAVDTGLRSRAEVILAGLDDSGLQFADQQSLTESDESFAQILARDGSVVEATSGLGQPLLAPSVVASLRRTTFFETTLFADREPVHARLLATPSPAGPVVVVGTSLEQHDETLAGLAALLWSGGGAALLLAAGVGWVLAGAALRPVEAMRKEVAAISYSEPGRRLAIPPTGDEVARLAETMNQMLERMAQALDRERRFVDDASHELRTPLGILKAELELALSRARSKEELGEALRSASEESDRLVKLAEDLLVLARADRGRLPVRREPIGLEQLVAAAIAPFEARAQQRAVRIEVHVSADGPVELDPVRIKQALSNLVDNALEHTPPGGRVTVECELQADEVRLRVADSGPGFPAGFVDHAFEPFTRADTGRARRDGGAGLGLAIVRAVAEAHGGRTLCYNRADSGAVVELILPVIAGVRTGARPGNRPAGS